MITTVQINIKINTEKSFASYYFTSGTRGYKDELAAKQLQIDVTLDFSGSNAAQKSA